MKEKYIYTEKIHHLSCIKCKKNTNTNDCSHEISKIQAAKLFELAGWIFIKRKGWFCPLCFHEVKI